MRYKNWVHMHAEVKFVGWYYATCIFKTPQKPILESNKNALNTIDYKFQR